MNKQECQIDTKYARRIFGKFNGNDNIFWEQDIRLGEQIPLIQILDNSRAIIQECLAGFGKLQNMVEILCPPTYSPSLIKTG